MEKSLKSLLINKGIYLGLALSAFTILVYVFNIEIFVNFWIMLLLLPLAVIIYGVFSSARAKSFLGGYMSFKQAFASYFIPVAIGSLISIVVTIVIFNYVDPESAEFIKDLSIEKSREFMENMGAPASEIDKQLALAEQQDTFGIGTQLKNTAGGLLFYAVIGLIVGLIMRKKDPNEA